MKIRLAVTLWVASVVLVTAQEPRGLKPALYGTASAKATASKQDLSLFSHSENCIACHNNLMTPSGEDVSIGATWRSTMMANSARDPYWQAGVRRDQTAG